MAQAAAPPDDRPQQGGFSWTRMLLILAVYYYFFSSPQKQQADPTATIDATTGLPVPVPSVPQFAPFLLKGTSLDFYLYLSEKSEAAELHADAEPVWTRLGHELGNWDEESSVSSRLVIPAPELVRNNGSLYAHVHMYNAHADPHHDTPLLTGVHPLNRYVKTDLAKFAKKNLVSGEVDESWLERERWEKEMKEKGVESTSTVKVLSHWKGNLTINLVQDFNVFKPGQIPDPLLKHFVFTPEGKYYPVLFFNDFWLLTEDLLVLNETVTELELDIAFAPLSFLKFSLYAQMEESFSLQRSMLGAEESEMEDLKRVLLDNNPYILALTMVISIAHTVLDTLAFKNDIQFWREKKSMEGMSVRTIYVNIITSLIILLYLLDNDTSYMILFSVGVGLLIECWKITRAAKVTVGRFHGIPYPIVTDKDDYVNTTKGHDLDAMKYLHWAAYPLLAAYAVYALIYENHKSWYSFVIGTLAGAVYSFGFIAMTPQLFIKYAYKLKSVAHLPGRVFVYKFLSTFIDDLFAFLIRMPTLHRLRVFRDDIVFFVYLYQRWIYPVDKKRIEIGADFADVSLAEIEAAKEEKRAKDESAKTKTE